MKKKGLNEMINKIIILMTLIARDGVENLFNRLRDEDERVPNRVREIGSVMDKKKRNPNLMSIENPLTTFSMFVQSIALLISSTFSSP